MANWTPPAGFLKYHENKMGVNVNQCCKYFTYFAKQNLLLSLCLPCQGALGAGGFIKGQIIAVAGQAKGIYKAVEAGQTILADT